VPRGAIHLGDSSGFLFDSILVLFVLLLLLAASVGMFWLLLWRETSRRREQAMLEWARANGFRLRSGAEGRPPMPLSLFGTVRIGLWFEGKRCLLVRFAVQPQGDLLNAVPQAAGPLRRNVLIWPIETNWLPAALRPVMGEHSLVDLLNLPAQSTGTSTQRFTAHAAERKVAAAVAESSLRGLLPPDVGLLLLGRHVVLEFSGRPFDEIEFNRMIAVAGQVVAHLPAVT
jgi:hypothetical protein